VRYTLRSALTLPQGVLNSTDKSLMEMTLKDLPHPHIVLAEVFRSSRVFCQFPPVRAFLSFLRGPTTTLQSDLQIREPYRLDLFSEFGIKDISQRLSKEGES
jgi:hypothetical protein